jgi:hypothetical protein
VAWDSPLDAATTTDLLYQPQRIDDGDCGAVRGIKIGRGNRSTRRKPAPAPLCSPQIPHDLSWDRTRAAAGGRPATNRLSCGAALLLHFLMWRVWACFFIPL